MTEAVELRFTAHLRSRDNLNGKRCYFVTADAAGFVSESFAIKFTTIVPVMTKDIAVSTKGENPRSERCWLLMILGMWP